MRLPPLCSRGHYTLTLSAGFGGFRSESTALLGSCCEGRRSGVCTGCSGLYGGSGSAAAGSDSALAGGCDSSAAACAALARVAVRSVGGGRQLTAGRWRQARVRAVSPLYFQ